jgi:hypothetical protein
MSFPSGLKKTVHESIDHLTAVDPIFNSIIEKGGASNSRTSTRIETLVLLILEQQVLIQLKLLFKIKGRDKIFDPAVLMDLSDQEFRYWRKPAKTSYIKALSFAVISKI